MALTAISTELDIKPGQSDRMRHANVGLLTSAPSLTADEQWLISAYTMVFGGFLLLAGVFADRWGKVRASLPILVCVSSY